MNKQTATRVKNILRGKGYSTSQFSNNGFVVSCWKRGTATRLVRSLVDAVRL